MEILFFAAIAFLILLKLGSTLGRVDEEEKNRILAKVAKVKEQAAEIQNKIIQKIAEISEEQKQIDEKILSELNPAVKENLVNILQRCNISAQFFFKGVQSVFEMSLKAFAGNDLNTLKTLLSENVYNGFEAAIKERELQGQVLTTNLIAIDKTEIIAANLFDNSAVVVVKIVSRQINYVSDKFGQVVAGQKDAIHELTDIWSFKKDVTSQDPNWVISNTAS
jgi:predicted lipid-binding transport protein (Tim44 family)